MLWQNIWGDLRLLAKKRRPSNWWIAQCRKLELVEKKGIKGVDSMEHAFVIGLQDITNLVHGSSILIGSIDYLPSLIPSDGLGCRIYSKMKNALTNDQQSLFLTSYQPDVNPHKLCQGSWHMPVGRRGG